jgi:nucleoside-triphosphatase
MAPNILLTGVPGIGKTTAIRKIADLLGADASGFYTEEKRAQDRRVGFEIVTLAGKRAPLSNVDIPGGRRVGRYGVDVASIDSVAVPAIDEAIAAGRIVIVDEIGKMELFSSRFRESVVKAFDAPCPVVAVIMLKQNPFADALKERDDAELIELTMANRDEIPARIVAQLRSQK